MRKHIESKKNKYWIITFFIIACFAYGMIIFIRSIQQSFFSLHKDRINVLFYREQTDFLSFGLTDKVHYWISFDNDLMIDVPGGYGQYKIGSIARLAQLEKKPQLIRNAFSSATSAFVHFYFYPKKIITYTEMKKSNAFSSSMSIVFSPHYNTNASLTDRILLFFIMLNKRKNDFLHFESRRTSSGSIFLDGQFSDLYKGYFYQKKFREEGKKVSIIYSNYSAVERLSRILEGEGIRIVDQTFEKKSNSQCIIEDTLHDHERVSLTSSYIAEIFHCRIINKKKGGNLLFVLGGHLEKEWE